MSLATFIVVGRLTRDPSIEITGQGHILATFSVAANKRKQVNGEWKDVAQAFYDVKAWNQLADNMNGSIRKGDEVIVIGELEHSSWETKDGEKRSRLTVTAEAVGISLRSQRAEVRNIASATMPAAPADDWATVAPGEPVNSDEVPF